MQKMKLVIGDWSKDGHSESRDVIYDVNKTVTEVQEAYKLSCRLTGVQFNHSENYTDKPLRDDLLIAVEYEGSHINEECKEILETHGINVELYCGHMYMGNYCIEDFEGLWWEFVKLSLLDVEYKEVKEEIPCINGYWNENLNTQFGYGMF